MRRRRLVNSNKEKKAKVNLVSSAHFKCIHQVAAPVQASIRVFCVQTFARRPVHRCLQNKAPEYLVDCCTPVSNIPSRRHLRPATRHHLTVPRYRLSTFGRRWSDSLELTTGQESPRPSAHRQQLQTIAENEPTLSLLLSTHNAVEMLHDSALYKSIIDIDIYSNADSA